MAQFNADILLQLKTEALDKKLKKVEQQIGKISGTGVSTKGLENQYNRINKKLDQATKTVIKRGLAEKTNTRELRNQT